MLLGSEEDFGGGGGGGANTLSSTPSGTRPGSETNSYIQVQMKYRASNGYTEPWFNQLQCLRNH